MPRQAGLRERKKAAQRERIADAAERLFATRGFDAVSVLEVAQEADVSEQTVYNYFPAKHDLALDRADEIREAYRTAVAERGSGVTPADALRGFALNDVERYRTTDPDTAGGEFYALCVSSPIVRRYGLVVRDEQTAVVREAITATSPEISLPLAHTHAAALVSVFQLVADHIGQHIAAKTPPAQEADALLDLVNTAFDALSRHFELIAAATPHPLNVKE